MHFKVWDILFGERGVGKRHGEGVKNVHFIGDVLNLCSLCTVCSCASTVYDFCTRLRQRAYI